MPITPLPTPTPSRARPATFADEGDAFLGGLPLFASEANALQAAVNAAEAWAILSASTAQAGANATIAISQAAVWVSGTTYVLGVVRWSPLNFRSYRRKYAGGGTTDPSLDSVNWAEISTSPAMSGNAGKFLSTDGTSSSWQFALPSQSGHAGEVLSTNGTVASWVPTGAGAYQATLVSGTNIKTVNGSSLLGSGDLVIAGDTGAAWSAF